MNQKSFDENNEKEKQQIDPHKIQIDSDLLKEFDSIFS